MAGAGSSWRIATLRPGEDPIGNLASALNAKDVLGVEGEFASTNQVLIEATLRRSSLGLVEAVRQARIPPDHNVLVLVDQFEELFRFRRSLVANSRDEAVAFVKLLLDAAGQQRLPIYIVLTMRSDFIGDCMDFRGLPEAVNAGLYLVGRMTRDGLRAALTGPVAVAGGTIAPRLVTRILNDLGDDHDQLPLVQHAMMRTWEFWAAAKDGQPIDIDDYEAVGTYEHALSLHAEEAYMDNEAAGRAQVAERVFKALTDRVSDVRGVRRPTAVSELAAIAGASEADVIAVVDCFRQAGRSFLMPPAAVALTSRSVIDLSHESLMRCWDRLIAWAEQERVAAAFYARLSQAAAWHEQGSAGLWRNPELELAAQWRGDTQPTAAWASRYDSGFDRAMTFLDTSLREWQAAIARDEHQRRTTLRRTQVAAGVLATLLAAAVALAVVARRESRRAEANLELARAAVDESLSSAERSSARVGADTPDVEELRRELLSKAERFYAAFMYQAPRSEASRRDLALAHMRLGHIHRLMGKLTEAEQSYRTAIERLTDLDRDFVKVEYRALLGSAWNWLGEVLRPQVDRAAQAEAAYDRALDVQRQVAGPADARPQYREELARTLYNRGILLSGTGRAAERAEQDFREAIALLEPLAGTNSQAAQELARAYNNLGSLLALSPGRDADAQRLWEQAIAIDERLLAGEPGNREYSFELATYLGNLAALLHERGDTVGAERRSAQMLALMDALAKVAPSLAVARADAHSVRGTILRERDDAAALQAFAEALDLFTAMKDDQAVLRTAEFHLRLEDLLVNLAALARDPRRIDGASRLLSRAVSLCLDVAGTLMASGLRTEAQHALEAIDAALPAVADADRPGLTARRRALTGP